MKLYVQLANGSYVYSKLFSYSPKTYATNQLQNSTDARVKSLMVAMLNYAAAAQTYFAYKPYDLTNKDLTAAQKSLISSYNSTMVPSSGSVSTAKAGIFTNSGGFSKKVPAVTFGSAFSIEYFFTPAYTPSGNVTMYYWTQADYNAVGTLTSANASGRITMTAVGDGSYHCAISGIAAKDLAAATAVYGYYANAYFNG